MKTAGPWAFVLLLTAWIAAGCGDTSGSPVDTQCPPDGCSTCIEGRSECRGAREARCQAGVWAERNCEMGCANGRCVECLEGDRRCNDERTAEACENGVWQLQACAEGICDGGQCLCPGGATHCADDRTLAICGASGEWTLESCPADRTACVQEEGLARCLPCRPGAQSCASPETLEICQPDGTPTREVCSGGCDIALGACIESCTPGVRRCRGVSTIQKCSVDGSHYTTVAACDTIAGERCAEGTCIRPCDRALDELAPSGCHYIATPVWMTRLTVKPGERAVAPDTRFHLLNPSPDIVARVQLTDGGVVLGAADVPPGGSQILSVDSIATSPLESVRVRQVVEITSNHPVYVVPYISMRDYGGGEDSLSGDADFLLPEHLLSRYGTRYRVMTQPYCDGHNSLPPTSGRPPNTPRPGAFTVASLSSSSETTTIDITPTAHTAPDTAGKLPGMSPGVTHRVWLLPGEALHLRVQQQPPLEEDAEGDDLTGTLVEADRPVAVFNGGVSRVPCSAGHIQAQMLEQFMPVGLWGDPTLGEHAHRLLRRRYYYTGSYPPSEWRGNERWVAITDSENTRLVIDPAPGGGLEEVVLPTAGSFHRIESRDADGIDPEAYTAFEVRSDKPIAIARYHLGSSGTASSFALERPAQFWRQRYMIHSVGSSNTNRLLVIAPTGAEVRVDGEPVAGPSRAGPPGHVAWETTVDARVHTVAADVPVGLLVYGVPGDGAPYGLPFDGYSYTGPVGFGDTGF